jgi:hypothetical protein
LELSDQERARRSRLAKQLVAQGKFGGARYARLKGKKRARPVPELEPLEPERETIMIGNRLIESVEQESLTWEQRAARELARKDSTRHVPGLPLWKGKQLQHMGAARRSGTALDYVCRCLRSPATPTLCCRHVRLVQPVSYAAVRKALGPEVEDHLDDVLRGGLEVRIPDGPP